MARLNSNESIGGWSALALGTGMVLGAAGIGMGMRALRAGGRLGKWGRFARSAGEQPSYQKALRFGRGVTYGADLPRNPFQSLGYARTTQAEHAAARRGAYGHLPSASNPRYTPYYNAWDIP